MWSSESSIKVPSRSINVVLGCPRVEGEELFELIDDEKSPVVALAPTGDHWKNAPSVADVEELLDRLHISREFRHQGSGESENRGLPGLKNQHAPSVRSRRNQPRPKERALADS